MSTLTSTGAHGQVRGDALDGSARRRRRALVARKLLGTAPDVAAALDWDALDAAPAWLALPDTELMMLARQVGAVLCASSIRMWIDNGRLAAARVAVGPAFLQALLALPEVELLPRNVAPCPRIDGPEQVAAMLRTSGLSVLVAALPSGALRRGVVAALGTTASSMAQVLAHSLVTRAQTLTMPRASARATAPAGAAPKSMEGTHA